MTDFVNFRVGKHYGFTIPYLDVVAVFVLADTFGNIRHGIDSCVFQEVDPIILLVLPLYGILVGDSGILRTALLGMLVDAFRIENRHLRVEQVFDNGMDLFLYFWTN